MYITAAEVQAPCANMALASETTPHGYKVYKSVPVMRAGATPYYSHELPGVANQPGIKFDANVPDEVLYKTADRIVNLPVTLSHPQLNADNWYVSSATAKEVTVGTTFGTPTIRDIGGVNHLCVDMQIFDDAAINKIENEGFKQVSPGYRCMLQGDIDTGVEITDFAYDHVAMVFDGTARGGQHCRVANAINSFGEMAPEMQFTPQWYNERMSNQLRGLAPGQTPAGPAPYNNYGGQQPLGYSNGYPSQNGGYPAYNAAPQPSRPYSGVTSRPRFRPAIANKLPNPGDPNWLSVVNQVLTWLALNADEKDDEDDKDAKKKKKMKDDKESSSSNYFSNANAHQQFGGFNTRPGSASMADPNNNSLLAKYDAYVNNGGMPQQYGGGYGTAANAAGYSSNQMPSAPGVTGISPRGYVSGDRVW